MKENNFGTVNPQVEVCIFHTAEVWQYTLPFLYISSSILQQRTFACPSLSLGIEEMV
eukprot:c44268_g1_i1 orf=2-169(-)